MYNKAIFVEINRLVTEVHRPEADAIGRCPDNPEHDQLRRIETTLDQCWDLLRQRRAGRQASENADEAKARDAGTVERYLH